MSIKATKPAHADPVYPAPYTLPARKQAAREAARDAMSTSEYADALAAAKAGEAPR